MNQTTVIVDVLAAAIQAHQDPKEPSAAVKTAYQTLLDHLTTAYTNISLHAIQRKPGSAGVRELLAEDLAEAGAGDDAELAHLALALANALYADAPTAAQRIAVDLETVRAELIRLRNIRSSATAARLSGVEAKQLDIADTLAGAGDALFRAEFKRSRVGKLNVNLQTGGRNDGALRRRYLQWILSSLNRVQIDGIDPEMAKNADAGRLKLSAIYTGLLTEAPDFAEQMRPAMRVPDDKPRRLSAVERLNRQPKLVLLGDPGSGKSTFDAGHTVHNRYCLYVGQRVSS